MKMRLSLNSVKQSKICLFLLGLVLLISLVGIYAPLFASSKPICIVQDHKIYFPLFRFLFYKSYYTKDLDLFFNLLMFTLPLIVLVWKISPKKKMGILLISIVHILLFLSCTHKIYTPSIMSTIPKNYPVVEVKPSKASYKLYPLIHKHWQDNALYSNHNHGLLNTLRFNGQNLWATLIFGIRYSLSLALLTSLIAFAIGIIIGALAGYVGGKTDLLICRAIEVWESLPTLFVLLTLVSLTQSTGFFFIIAVLALFSWTSIARMVRLEFLKQKHLAYVEVLRNLEVSSIEIIFRHLLPNCYWMLVALFPYALIGAVTCESTLSFLGLGDRSSCSIGLLLDEARVAYPMDPKLFWPPALLLVGLYICFAWLGDLFRKLLDPKLYEHPF